MSAVCGILRCGVSQDPGQRSSDSWLRFIEAEVPPTLSSVVQVSVSPVCTIDIFQFKRSFLAAVFKINNYCHESMLSYLPQVSLLTVCGIKMKKS